MIGAQRVAFVAVPTRDRERAERLDAPYADGTMP